MSQPKEVVAKEVTQNMKKGEVFKGYVGYERTNDKGDNSWITAHSLWGVWNGEKIIPFINKDGAENFSRKIKEKK